jgi:hypothetical protein
MGAPPATAAFLQVPQIATTLTLHAISTNTFEGLTPVFLALAKMTDDATAEAAGTDAPTDYGVVGAESDAVTQLKTLLNEFLTNTETQLENLRTEEAGRVTEYGRVMELLATMVTKLDGELAEMATHLLEMERCINTESTIVAASKAKFTRNQGIFTATENMCQIFDDEYLAAEEARVHELALLASLKTMVTEKLASESNFDKMEDSALEQEDGFVSYDSGDNYGYEEKTFEGSEFDSTSEDYVGAFDAETTGVDA